MKKKFWQRLVGLGAVLSVSLGGMGHAGSDRQAVDVIAAIVNDDIVSQSEVTAMLLEVKRDLSKQGVQLPSDTILRQQVLERIILERIQFSEADKQGIRIDDETLNQAMIKLAEKEGLSLTAYRQRLASEHIDFADFREKIRKDILLSRLYQREIGERVVVSEQEIDARSRSQTGKNLHQEYHLLHILLALPQEPTQEEMAQKQSLAEKVVNQLREGAEFRALAVKFSDDPQALQGGDLGWLTLDEVPTPLMAKVPQLAVGEVAEPVRSSFGFHIVKLADKRVLSSLGNKSVSQSGNGSPEDRERVRELLFQRKRQEQMSLWLRRLRDDAYVEIREK